MGRVGSALDNAASEAFNSTIKVEYIHRHRFRTRVEARLKIETWIVDFYNTRRRHSACDGMSPIDYERYMAEARGAKELAARNPRGCRARSASRRKSGEHDCHPGPLRHAAG